MVDSLNLDVEWPDGRTVSIHVRLELYAAMADGPREDVDAEPLLVNPIDSDTLASRESLNTFLKDITRGEAAGSRVEALCWAQEKSRLLELLGVDGPPPDPIQVELKP